MAMLRSRCCAAAGRQPKCTQKLKAKRKRCPANDHHPSLFHLLLMQHHFSSFGLEAQVPLLWNSILPTLLSQVHIYLCLLSNRPFAVPSATKLVSPGNSWSVERDGLSRERIVSSESKCFRELRPLTLFSVHSAKLGRKSMARCGPLKAFLHDGVFLSGPSFCCLKAGLG